MTKWCSGLTSQQGGPVLNSAQNLSVWRFYVLPVTVRLVVVCLSVSPAIDRTHLMTGMRFSTSRHCIPSFYLNPGLLDVKILSNH